MCTPLEGTGDHLTALHTVKRFVTLSWLALPRKIIDGFGCFEVTVQGKGPLPLPDFPSDACTVTRWNVEI